METSVTSITNSLMSEHSEKPEKSVGTKRQDHSSPHLSSNKKQCTNASTSRSKNRSCLKKNHTLDCRVVNLYDGSTRKLATLTSVSDDVLTQFSM